MAWQINTLSFLGEINDRFKLFLHGNLQQKILVAIKAPANVRSLLPDAASERLPIQINTQAVVCLLKKSRCRPIRIQTPRVLFRQSHQEAAAIGSAPHRSTGITIQTSLLHSPKSFGDKCSDAVWMSRRNLSNLHLVFLPPLMGITTRPNVDALPPSSQTFTRQPTELIRHWKFQYAFRLHQQSSFLKPGNSPTECFWGHTRQFGK